MNKTRSGFTLVELLVVITIIGILMGLLIPAVNAAREAGRKAQCAANIRNFSLGSIQYENSKGEMPSWCQSFGSYTAPSGGLADPSDPDLTVTASDHPKIGTWTVALMPYLDAQATYEVWTEDKYPIVSSGSGENPASSNGFTKNAAPNLEVMQCPSSPTTDATHGRNSYISNNGMHHFDVAGSPIMPDGSTAVTFAESMSKANSVFVNGYVTTGTAPNGVTLDDMKDGQGYTVLFAENLQAEPWHRSGLLNEATLTAGGTIAYPMMARFTTGMVWHWADPSQLNSVSATPSQQVLDTWRINGGVGTQDKFNVSMKQANTVANLVYNANLARPSSAHVDGVNMAFADASVRFVQDSIDYRVYQALMTPRGKSSNVPFNEYVLNSEAL